MKGFFGIVLVCVGFGVSLCGLVATMLFVGFGTPNCEQTLDGYAEFWSNLFLSGFAASFGLWCVVSSCCIISDRFLSKTK